MKYFSWYDLGMIIVIFMFVISVVVAVILMLNIPTTSCDIKNPTARQMAQCYATLTVEARQK